jgi:F-type H+-transporting ATPase subunit b
MRIKSCFFLLFSGLVACPSLTVAAHAARFRAPILLLQAAVAETGRRGEILDLINLVILIAVLAYLLRKPIGRFFNQRSEEIRKSLEDGRKALAAAQNQLAAAEEKLRRLKDEIAVLKESASREMAAERERMLQAAQEEGERILASARSMIHSATQAAKLELRVYAARQATELAEKMIKDRMNEQDQTRLVDRFLRAVPDGQNRKEPLQ